MDLVVVVAAFAVAVAVALLPHMSKKGSILSSL